MNTRYIITIGDDEEPIRVEQELTPGTVTVLITAHTFEEAQELCQRKLT